MAHPETEADQILERDVLRGGDTYAVQIADIERKLASEAGLSKRKIARLEWNLAVLIFKLSNRQAQIPDYLVRTNPQRNQKN